MKPYLKTVLVMTIVTAVLAACQPLDMKKMTLQEKIATTAFAYQGCRVLAAKGEKVPQGRKDCKIFLDAFEKLSVTAGVKPAKAKKLTADLKKNTTLALHKNKLS
jgi:nitrous oxide reductase accessory protein NosL